MGQWHNAAYHKGLELNNFPKTINKTDKDITIQTKLDIISLAYTDSLTASDLIELASILTTISNMKPIKKKGL